MESTFNGVFSFLFDLTSLLVLSCVFALGVNISNYLVLGKTSPLTYQVLGHLKTVLILILGFTVFEVRKDNVSGLVVMKIYEYETFFSYSYRNLLTSVTSSALLSLWSGKLLKLEHELYLCVSYLCRIGCWAVSSHIPKSKGDRVHSRRCPCLITESKVRTVSQIVEFTRRITLNVPIVGIY